MIFGVFFLASNGPSYYKILQVNLFTPQIPMVDTTKLLELPETYAADPHDGVLPVLQTPVNIQNRISIPSINVDARIVEVPEGEAALIGGDWTSLEQAIKSSLKEGVVHYPGTALAGEEGNFFLTGHSSNVFWEKSAYNNVFATLPNIEIGDEILIEYNQKTYTYKVTAKEEVTPKDIDVLAQGEGKEISLLTCVPVGTRLKRLHVIGELVEE